MEILDKSGELTKVLIYKMTASPEVQTISKIEDNTVIKVSAWIHYTDVNNQTGEHKELLSIYDEDKNTAFACESKTFIRSFFEIDDIMSDELSTGEIYSIKKISGTTKAGRPYINCVLHC